MKILYYPLLLVTSIVFSCITCKKSCNLDDEFYSDLASANKRINAELYLDYFDSNLETLTYEYYLKYLKDHAKPSEEGVYGTILCADDHYFKAKKESFLIILYYKEEKRIIGDVAKTPNLDTSLIYYNFVSKKYFEKVTYQMIQKGNL